MKRTAAHRHEQRMRTDSPVVACIAVTMDRHRRGGSLARGIALVALALVLGLPARAQADEPGTWAATSGHSSSPIVSMAQPGSPAVQPPGSPAPTPGPIVPRGNPIGTLGIVAMAVAAVAGLWIYRVIRKGL